MSSETKVTSHEPIVIVFQQHTRCSQSRNSHKVTMFSKAQILLALALLGVVTAVDLSSIFSKTAELSQGNKGNGNGKEKPKQQHMYSIEAHVLTDVDPKDFTADELAAMEVSAQAITMYPFASITIPYSLIFYLLVNRTLC